MAGCVSLGLLRAEGARLKLCSRFQGDYYDFVTTKSKRICLLGVSLNTGNLGVSALASGTVESVMNCLEGAEVFVLDYSRQPVEHRVRCRGGDVSVRMVNLRFSKKLYLSNNIAWLLAISILVRVLPRSWRVRCLARNHYLKAILDSDVVASLAGGDSFSDIYGLGRLLYVTLPQLLVLQLGKPLVLLPQTLGPFKSRLAKLIGGHVLRRAQVVYSRDRICLDETRTLLGNRQDRLKFSYDMAFALEPAQPDGKKLSALPPKGSGRTLVGLNVSGLLLMGGYTRDNMFGLKSDYGRLIEEIIACFIQNYNCDILLVPHVFGDSNESDASACACTFQELHPRFPGRLYSLNGEFDQHEIKYVIGRCDFFLGARMHACIAALSQRVPAVGMAYSGKFAGVLESVGCGELVIDLCKSDQAQVLAIIDQHFAGRERIRQFLNMSIPRVRETVLELFRSEEIVGKSFMDSAHGL